jgi:dynein heavy chain, axonemal
VPNIWTSEEKAEILELMGPVASKLGKGDSSPAQLYALFIENVKKNLHIVLCFSPIGDAFRTRVR